MRIHASLRLGIGLACGLAAGCTGGGNDPPAIDNRITLQNFGNCSDLQRWMQESAVKEMRADFEAMKRGDGFWGFGRGGVLTEGDAAAPTAGGAENGAKSAPSSYTTTNTQVKGVDEADFMKNDGTRIFVLSGRKLFTAKSWPAPDLAHAGELLIEGWPSSMFLDEKNRVVVMSNVWLPEFRSQNSQSAPCSECWWSGNATKLTVVDVSVLAKPAVAHEYYLPGWFVNARRVGSSVRVVQSDWFRWPDGVKWYPDYQPGLWDANNKALLNARLDALADENERIIRATPIDKWLPDGKRRADDGTLVDLGYQCSDFYASNAPTHLGLVTVATLNLDKPAAPPTRTSVIAEPGEIFASTDNLYIASSHWWWWPAPGQVDHTYVHKFDITNPDTARYVASGGFDGHIVDQFSMDEWNGWFRVASTITSRVPDLQNPQNRWGTVETTNRVFVLGERSGALEVVGQTEEMAKGERIQSSRFTGDRGYIVTFRQVDPLFTLDLSSPTNPRRVGELKVPGFSSYIHPIDKDHLLTIGTFVPDPNGGQPDWRARRMQLSIFDVSDFANPKQTANETVGTAYGWSEAAWEHKAFNYFPERGLLAIPFSDYSPQAGPNYWDSFISDLRVFRIDAQKGITGLGAITMKDIYRQRNEFGWQYWWSPWIRRSVMASDEAKSDFVYAVSDAGIRVSNAQSLGTPIATTLFPANMPKP